MNLYLNKIKKLNKIIIKIIIFKMNKAIQILLLALCAIGIKSEFTECTKTSIPAEYTKTKDMVNFCRILTTGMDRTHCCYYKSDNYTEPYCREISDDAYENIKRYKKYLKNFDGNIEIKCSSDYFTYSLFVLFALLALLI